MVVLVVDVTGRRRRVDDVRVDVAHVLETVGDAGGNLDGLEGVVAKRLTSTYQPGRRSRDWVKTPLNRTQEVVIAWTDSRNTSKVRTAILSMTGN